MNRKERASSAAHAAPSKPIKKDSKCHPRTLDIPVSSSPVKKMIFSGRGEKRSNPISTHKPSQSPRRDSKEKRQPPQQPKTSPSSSSSTHTQFATICREVAQIRDEHVAIRKTLSEREGELGKTRMALRNIAQERDFLRNKVSELELLLKHSPKMYSHVASLLTNNGHIPGPAPPSILNSAEANSKSNSSPENNSLPSGIKADSPCPNGNDPASALSSPPPPTNINSLESHQLNNNNKREQNHEGNDISADTKTKCIYSELGHVSQSPPLNGNSSNENGNDIQTVTNNNNNLVRVGGEGMRQSGITGLDLMLLGPDCSTKVVEHLVHPIQIESSVREIQHTLVLKGVPLSGERLREVQIEIDRLNSRIDHLRSQNDVLQLNLEDAKSHADRLTVLLGKYESNNVALQMALRYSDKMTDAYEVLVALLETDMGQLLANLHSRGQLHLISSSTPSNNTTSESPAIITRSGNNNNSLDNSPSSHLPPATAEPISGNGSDPESIGNNNEGVNHQHNNNGGMTAETKLSPTSSGISCPTSSTSTITEQAKRNRLVAERAARFLLSRFASTSVAFIERGSICSSPSVTSNTSHISGESGQDSPEKAAIKENSPPPPAPQQERSSSACTVRSSPTSTFRDPLSPNGNGAQTVKCISPSSAASSPKTAIEPLLLNLISSLKRERDGVKQTVMELDSESFESLTPSPMPTSPHPIQWSADCRKLDLETAVLMQELMAMKEERAELRAQLFLLEKEKDSLELRLRSHQSQEDAYKARINYLKSEILDCKTLYQPPPQTDTYQDNRNRNEIITNNHPIQNGNRNLETITNNINQNGNWEREALLKKRIHDLASTLERVTVGSQLREKENEEMINELNRANGILMQTLDGAKKKYQNRIKKMEDQILYVSERHAKQMKFFGERLPVMGSSGKYHG